MPVITLLRERFSTLVGRRLTEDEMMKWLPWLGFDIEESGPGYVKVEFNPNRVDFSSHAGVARAFLGLRGWETGLPVYPVQHGDLTLTVSEKVSQVRPYVLAAVVRGVTLDDVTLRELIEMQEDLHWGLGRNRKKASIGVHNLDVVHPPFSYVTGDPKTVKFIPLDKTETFTLQEVLERHEKGQEYRHLVDWAHEYPLIVDRNGSVLSFPPIINGELTRLTHQTRNLFIDVTGFDLPALSRCLNILVTSLADLGGQIENVHIHYPDRVIVSPNLTPHHVTLRVKYAQDLLGLKLSEAEAIRCLQKSRLDAEKIDRGVLRVSIPAYRIDILHEVDLVEELAIGYGFFRLTPTTPATVTTGQKHEVSQAADYVRQAMIGLGYTEVLNFILTNEDDHYTKMRKQATHPITLTNPTSADYSIIRRSLLPGILRNLADNRHESYPQRIFEVSDTIKPNKRKDTRHERRIHVAGASCHVTSNFTEIKAVVESLLHHLCLEGWTMKTTRNSSFLPGRVAAVTYKRRNVGYLGEVHPQVLNNFNLEIPTGAFEIDLTELL